MAKKFDLFHLSLLERRQPDLFGSRVSREAWLRLQLKETFQFGVGDRPYYWVYHETIGNLIIGYAQRTARRRQHLAPSQGGVEIIAEEWQGSLVIIDPSHHENGQKVAFENDAIVGSPLNVISRLCDYLNTLPEAPYAIEVRPITNADDFWIFAKQHDGNLKYIRFDFVVPNMWNAASELEEELKNIGKTTKAHRASLRLDGPDGIDTTAPMVAAGVEHCTKGGGNIRAKAGNGEIFLSNNRQVSMRLSDEESRSTALGEISDSLAMRILGRAD